MAKKHKNHSSDENPNVSKSHNDSVPSTVFETLFGDISEQNSASNSLFSESNPFRRKLQDTRPSNQELGLKLEKKDAANVGNLGSLEVPELRQKRKRKEDGVKKGSSDDTGLAARKGKRLFTADSKLNEQTPNSNPGLESKETQVKDDEYFQGNSGSGDLANKKKKRNKRKRGEVEAEYEERRYGVTDESMEIKVESSVLGKKRKEMENLEETMVQKEGFDDEGKLLRTIFVGNLPLKLKRKEIIKEFGKFGEVESVRIRSVPIIDGKMPRKGAVIKQRINENGDSVHAYIVFKTEESAQAALTHNMAVVGGNHIRVDRACPPRKKLKGDSSPLYDHKRTVFVGNLPFDVKDEEIYQLFSSIKNLEASIEAVRVIRDPGSSLGKGIAYVLFRTMDAAKLMVKKHNLRLRGRDLRLSQAKSNATPSKRKYSSQPETNSYSAKKFAVTPTTPGSSNKVKQSTDLAYQGMRASKSGAQKKVPKRNSLPAKSNSQPASEQKSRMNKRPAVAARKEKALRAANAAQLAGTKRKLGNRTPGSSGQKKKERKFR